MFINFNVDGQYTDGCIELEGYLGKSCVDSHICQDMVKEELGQLAKVEGECMCQDGSTVSGSSCVSECPQPIHYT